MCEKSINCVRKHRTPIMQNAMANAERARANLQAMGGRIMDDQEHMTGADLGSGVDLKLINDLVNKVRYGGDASRRTTISLPFV